MQTGARTTPTQEARPAVSAPPSRLSPEDLNRAKLAAQQPPKISSKMSDERVRQNWLKGIALAALSLGQTEGASMTSPKIPIQSPRDEERKSTAERLRRIASDSLIKLPAASRNRVYAAVELCRNCNWFPPDDGRSIRVRNSSFPQAQKSKVGDNYLLTPDEVRTFHDVIKLNDESGLAFMAGLADGLAAAPLAQMLQAKNRTLSAATISTIDPWHWRLEHQLAFGVACALGALVGLFIGFAHAPFGSEVVSSHYFLVWLQHPDWYWSWPLGGAVIAGLAFYLVRLVKA